MGGELTKLGQSALYYARAGLRIFPLAKMSKLPAIAKEDGGRGFLDATSDEETIRRWWARFPDANIGLATGDGLLVIDIDVGGNRKGEETFDALQRRLGPLPPTRECLTGSGGRQLYTRVPAGFENIAKLGPNVDLKGAGGYVILPPSIHPQTRHEYLWDGIEGFKAEIAELPQTWRDASERRKATPAAVLTPADPTLANLRRIEKQCAWMRHCKADAEQLDEPSWFAMLTILARTQTGQRDAHNWSRPYPKYSAAETDKKFEHAKAALGPATCERIANELGGREPYCSKCPHWEKIQSPINTAYLAQERAPIAPFPESEGNPRPPATKAPTMRPDPTPPPAETWRELLLRNSRGRSYANLFNAALTLAEHPAAKRALVYDEFRDKAVLVRDLGDVVRGDVDDGRALMLAAWLQRELAPTLPESVSRSAIELTAKQTPVHPLRDWLRSLHWDGAIRVREGFFERYFHARRVALHLSALDQAVYWNEVASIWLVSMVARILRPGCLVDYCLVLEGASGSQKSRALEILASPQYFTNQLPARLDWTSAGDAIRGKWLVEVADLGGILQHENARQFITRREDQAKAALGRLGKITTPRQCVFAATTSLPKYLWDEVAQRFVVPIATSEIDTPALLNDREQIFAEAVQMFAQGIPWYPSPQLAAMYRREQEARLIEDPWVERVREFARHSPALSIPDLLGKYEVPFHQMDRKMQSRIERILHREGWRQEPDEDGVLYWRNPRSPKSREVLQ